MLLTTDSKGTKSRDNAWQTSVNDSNLHSSCSPVIFFSRSSEKKEKITKKTQLYFCVPSCSNRVLWIFTEYSKLLITWSKPFEQEKYYTVRKKKSTGNNKPATKRFRNSSLSENPTKTRYTDKIVNSEVVISASSKNSAVKKTICH